MTAWRVRPFTDADYAAYARIAALDDPAVIISLVDEEAAVARAPESRAPPTRLLLACPATTWTAQATFLAVETLPIGEF